MNTFAVSVIVGATLTALQAPASAQGLFGGRDDLGERGERVLVRGAELGNFSGDWQGVVTIAGASETARANGIQDGIELPLRLLINGYDVTVFFQGEDGAWAQFGGTPFRIEQSGRTGYIVAAFQPGDSTETWTFNLAPYFYGGNMMVYMTRVINVQPPFAFGAYGQLTVAGNE